MAKHAATVKKGNASPPPKKHFGSKTEYAPHAKTKINPDAGKK
jgi:hypothetical protein